MPVGNHGASGDGPLEIGKGADDRFGYLWGDLGSRLRPIGDVDDERVAVEVHSINAEVLAMELAGFGSTIEFEDIEVRRALARIGADLVAANR